MLIQIYEMKSIGDARKYLSKISYSIILSNYEGSTRYYGMRVIDYIFKLLQKEFTNKIKGIIVNVFDDYSALLTARELGYNNIKYDKNKIKDLFYILD